MGEYAKRLSDGAKIKIGACEEMLYLRFEDRYKVKPLPNSIQNLNIDGLFWRIPFPDEDRILPGDYNKPFRKYILVDFEPEETVEMPGMMQLRHESGLQISLPCYHGFKLPELPEPAKACWNGKFANFFVLEYIKKHEGRLYPIISCRACGNIWRTDWEEILPYVTDKELKKRLEKYAEYTEKRIRTENLSEAEKIAARELLNQ